MASHQGIPKERVLSEEIARIRVQKPNRAPGPLRILFVNPPSPDGHVYIRDVNRSGRLSREGTIWPQTSLAMLAAVFPGEDVKILDCIASNISYHALFKQMEEFAPDWVVFNPVSTTVTHDFIVAHYGKSLGAQTVAVSPHTKVLKEECHGRYPSLDYTVDYEKGGAEPEYRLRELISGIPTDGTEFAGLPPARQDLLPIHHYNLPFIGKRYTFVVTSRGCPWKCIYCRQNVMNENRVRFRPVSTVIEEIRQGNLRNVAFHADTATMNHPWIYEFCEAVKKLPWKLRWICNSRVDTVDKPLLKAMKDAGCWMVLYGCESGNDKVLALNKKDATVKQARDAVTWAKDAGLRVWGYFMLGMYGDTESSMQDTVDLACSLPFDIVNFSISAPYPGTEWYDIATSNDWLNDSRWESFDQNYSTQVDQPLCPGDLVRKFQRKAYRRWYFSLRGFKFLLDGFRPEYFNFFRTVISNHLKI